MNGRTGFPPILGTIVWLMAAAVAVWGTYASDDDRTIAIISAILLILSIAYSRIRLGLPFSSGPLLYLCLFSLFHLGMVVPWALGIYQPQGMWWFLPGTLSPAIRLITVSIACFQLGVILACATPHPSGMDAVRQLRSLPAAVYGGLLLFIAGTAMFLWALSHLGPNVTYEEIFRIEAESDPRLLVTGLMLAGIGLPIAAAGARGRQLWSTAGATAVWVVALMYLGFRGPALITAAVVYSIFVKKGHRVPRLLALGAIALILAAIPIVRLTRDIPYQERSLDRAWREAHVMDTFVDMGGSIRPLSMTSELMRNRKFLHGRTYLASLRTVLPNLHLHWSPPDDLPLNELPPSHWITAWADPWAYAHGGASDFRR